MKLNENRPVDHRLSNVYRFGSGLTGAVLIIFGILGLFNQLAFFDTTGQVIAGLSTNGALSVISVSIGSLLVGGAAIGGTFASTLNTVIGIGFIISGMVNLAVMDTSFNLLAFRIPNVIFSFVVGLMVMTFGMYGRFTGGLPDDNPFWRARHAQKEKAEKEKGPEEKRGPGTSPRVVPPRPAPQSRTRR
ncbi:DUF4383 domain-containing protein [Nocardiopsis ansamitocini]|uniref:DUF4383 domain-containing protein n=1 Tax=Nocardiopsis ansamitocini TaxID=1670832 RepID=A0A9W6P9Q1_9ACTN|nr:DUF4383 domain-containing protein [Nocardiopsis ansamitocini]GLU49740.1 hypothetical protein Nans01_40910 [Nocardiopsis ansamitocini]